MSNQFINLLKSFTKSSLENSMQQSKFTASWNFKQSPVPQTHKALKFLYSTQQSLIQSQGLKQSQLEYNPTSDSQVEKYEQDQDYKNSIKNSQFYNSIGKQMLQSSGVQTDTEVMSQKSVQFASDHNEQKPLSILLNKNQGKKFIYQQNNEYQQEQQQYNINEQQNMTHNYPEQNFQQIQHHPPQNQYNQQPNILLQQPYYQYQPMPYQYPYQPMPYIQINQPPPQYPVYPQTSQQMYQQQQQQPYYQQNIMQQQNTAAQPINQDNLQSTAIFVQQQPDNQNQLNTAQPSFTNTSLMQANFNEQDESINQTLLENPQQIVERPQSTSVQSTKKTQQIFSFEVQADELKAKNVKQYNQKQNLKQHSKLINKYMTKRSLQLLSQTSVQQKQSFVRQPRTQPQLIQSIQKLLQYYKTDLNQAEMDYFMDYYKVESLARKSNVELIDAMKNYEKNAVISTYLEYKNYKQLQFIYYIIMTQLHEDTWKGVQEVLMEIKLKGDEEQIKQQVIQLVQHLEKQFPQFIGKQSLAEVILQRYKQNLNSGAPNHDIIDLENEVQI